MTDPGTSAGESLDASVSSDPPADGEARTALLELAETLEGAAKDRILAMAAQLITPMEVAVQAADAAEAAVESIKDKIAGMEATLKARIAEASALRSAVNERSN